MNRKGQIAPRLLMLIMSWVVLFLVLIVAYLLQAASNETQSPSLEAVMTGPQRAAHLSSYLRRPVEVGGEQSLMAERIAIAVMNNRPIDIATSTEDFVKNIPRARHQLFHLKIIKPDKSEWDFGRELAWPTASSTSVLKLPDGREVKVILFEGDIDSETLAAGGEITYG
jgi:hypothetical protein